MGGGEDAQVLVDVTKDFGDRYAEITAYEVPESERYPEQ
ncbi:hypothetical protein HLRTI_001980 [Halorhabdus tiamatea SARL4B]|uniref:Uncharacterized protein n=1 Tax=Halorhabdus tiamatea SARL4B TaxID=1033806 RepID=F7PKM9_9EURY|nr:hypothetical protein HLRTI_001980 [Halorhabdus tiamatea SARL4B]CCQ34014.1 hypothetical protein HTIA_1895 [Halorhabdus tiamatea SARL4B]